MTKVFYLIFALLIPVAPVNAQLSPRKISSRDIQKTGKTDDRADRQLPPPIADSLATQLETRPAVKPVKKDSIPAPAIYGWRIDPRSADRIPVAIDTLLPGFHQKSLVDGQGLSVGYLGNWGAPAQSNLFFEREEPSVFPFLDAFDYLHRTAQKQRFLNTKIPYSNVYYQTAGSKVNSEERFKVELSSNFGKKLNVGFDLDYAYSRGFYSYLSNKHISYDFYGSYISDRYQLHAYAGNDNYNNSENGGVSDDRYITAPTTISDFRDDSKEIPVNLNRLWNRLKGRQIFVSNRYNVGYETGEDSLNMQFVPVASFILTTEYKDQQRRFASRDDRIATQNLTETDVFMGYDKLNDAYNIYYMSGSGNRPANDQMAYWSLKNTFAVSLNEGFRKWVKFGLTAFIEQDFRKFALPMTVGTSSDGNPELLPMVVSTQPQTSTIIGGMLTKQQGRFLRYNLRADMAMLGSDLGEFRLSGDIETSVKFAGKDASAKLTGYVKNLHPNYFQNNLRTKYSYWNRDLSDTRRIFAGGEIAIPQTGTKLSGGVENIQNHIYYNSQKQIDQTSKLIQVISLRAEQNLNAGILHWDNQAAYQLSSEKEIIPLPQLSLYSNLYLLGTLAKVLNFQLGVDAHYHTEYYAQGYDPSLLQFYNQRELKTGGFPIATAYLNLQLKKARFFIMMYNIGQSMNNPNYFSLPHYPVNPMTMKMGISWDFSN
ncbi:MAG: putative porin [Prevotella sp.]|jgi:hypothetical protein|nr:putative porin [Prevotella sp.]